MYVGLHTWRFVQRKQSRSKRTNGRTDMTKLITAFRKFCERAWNCFFAKSTYLTEIAEHAATMATRMWLKSLTTKAHRTLQCSYIPSQKTKQNSCMPVSHTRCSTAPSNAFTTKRNTTSPETVDKTNRRSTPYPTFPIGLRRFHKIYPNNKMSVISTERLEQYRAFILTEDCESKQQCGYLLSYRTYSLVHMQPYASQTTKHRLR
jgi:hypothetical protein